MSLARPMAAFVRRLWRTDAGVSALEFALMLPILVMLSVGTIEYSRLILVTQKVQNAAFALSDLATRDGELKAEDITDIFVVVSRITEPFAFKPNGRAIVSNLTSNAQGKVVVNWRCQTGVLNKTSAIAAGIPVTTLPGGIPLAAGETVVVGEVFYAFKPLFDIGLGPREIRRTALNKPRLGELPTSPCP